MAELTRVIDTDRGTLLVTVQCVADRYATGELTADDLLKAAHALFEAATFVGKTQLRRLEPEAATVGVVEEGAQVTGPGGEL